MKRQANSGRTLFLMELMLAIFFFAVIVAVCIQIFAEAHQMSVTSEQLTQKVNIAANIAEDFAAAEQITEKEINVYYGKDGFPVDKDGDYVALVWISKMSKSNSAADGASGKHSQTTGGQRDRYQLQVAVGKAEDWTADMSQADVQENDKWYFLETSRTIERP